MKRLEQAARQAQRNGAWLLAACECWDAGLAYWTLDGKRREVADLCGPHFSSAA